MAISVAVTLRSLLTRALSWAEVDNNFTAIKNALAGAVSDADLASPAAGKGAAMLGSEDAGGYFVGATQEAINQEIGNPAGAFANDYNLLRQVPPGSWAGVMAGSVSVLPYLRAAVAAVKARGGGRVYMPYGTYSGTLTTDADAVLIDGPVTIISDPGTTLSHNAFAIPVIAIVGATGAGVENLRLVFTGTRPGSAPAPGARFGFGATGVSGADWSAHIVVAGSSMTRIRNCQFEGAAISNVKEICVAFFGGSASGVNFDGGTAQLPGANAVYSTDNEISGCLFNDCYFGVTASLQSRMTARNLQFRRYSNSGFTGGGHCFYMTGMCLDSEFSDFFDYGESVTTPGSGTYPGCVSWQFRSPHRCIIKNLKSQRVEGSHSIQNDARGNIFDNIHWSASRQPYEAGLVNTPVVTVVNADATSVIEENQFSNWFIHDGNGGGRSANCPVFGFGGATSVSANTRRNNWSNIQVTFYPDGSFGKSVLVLGGQQDHADFILNNQGTGSTKSLLQLLGSAAGTMSGNVVDLTLMGPVTSFQVAASNSNQDNTVRVYGSGALANTGTGLGSGSTTATGDRVIFDRTMYQVINPGTRTPDLTQHSSIEISLSATATTINAPLNPYVGARLRFRLIQDATGGRAVTWNAAFKKAADGAGAANAIGCTEFEYTSAGTWVQIGGALAYY